MYSQVADEVQRWDQVHDKESPIEDFTEGQDARWADPTGETFLKTTVATETLNSISDPRTRHAAHMVMLGATFAEAGKAVGLSAAAVEGKLYRMRKRSQ